MPEPNKVDRNICPRCGGQTRCAQLGAQDTMVLIPKEHAGKFFPPHTGCETYVCMTCGHVELFAESFEPFFK